MSICILHVGNAFIHHSSSDPSAFKALEFCMSSLQEPCIGFEVCVPLPELLGRNTIETSPGAIWHER